MYAVFEDGSHQYKVSEGELVQVDFRAGDGSGAPVGSTVEFAHVLLYKNGDDTRIGQPMLDGMRVVGEVVEHPSKKLYIQHFRRRKTYKRLRGHRQWHTAVRVSHILLPGAEAPPPAPKAAKAPQGDKPAGAPTA